jgi:hypothetical protein
VRRLEQECTAEAVAPVAHHTAGHDLGCTEAKPVQSSVEALFDIQNGADLKTFPELISTGDVVFMPLAIVRREIVEEGPNPLGGGLDEDRIRQSNHGAESAQNSRWRDASSLPT